jgi:hypothetical protein
MSNLAFLFLLILRYVYLHVLLYMQFYEISRLLFNQETDRSDHKSPALAYSIDKVYSLNHQFPLKLLRNQHQPHRKLLRFHYEK